MDLRQSRQLCSALTRHSCSAHFSLLQRRQHVVGPFFFACPATPRVLDGKLRPQLLRTRAWRAEDHLSGRPSLRCFKEEKNSGISESDASALTRREMEVTSSLCRVLSAPLLLSSGVCALLDLVSSRTRSTARSRCLPSTSEPHRQRTARQWHRIRQREPGNCGRRADDLPPKRRN